MLLIIGREICTHHENVLALYSSELKRNKIKIVESLTFKGMDSLKILKMQRNSITKLMDGAFFGLTNIEELWVQSFL